MKSLFVFLSMLSTAHADQAGFLKDFNFQVSDVKTMREAQSLEDSMSIDTRNKSICANRAHFWANDLHRMKNIQTGKVFIHFTKEGQADENGEWAYHVAPYVIVNGQEVVLDPAFAVFEGKPVALGDWTKYFGKSSNCVVLDPANNPKHLELEKNNLNADWMTPLDFKYGARQYPSTEGICYIRKVPMYYQYPVNVYGVDLLHNGKNEYKDFSRQSFNQNEVLSACSQAMSLNFKIEHSCSSYLGIRN